MKYSRYFFTVLTVSFLMASESAVASPEVSGSIISWPDDGWYQVQRADSFISVCEGGRSCQVSPGSYIVVNHSTGERFDNIVVDVADASGINSGTIEVSGNTISWPDDGWYEVQNAFDFSTLCQGGRDCQVAPGGTYTVINHTTGQRFEYIELGGEDDEQTPPASETPVVTGNIVSWQGSGYFQLQTTPGYQTLCEGEINTCNVPNGTYQLVNHTSGEVWNDVRVSDSTERPPESTGPDNTALSDAQRARLPSDCLLDTDAESTAYCFSPAERRFIAVTNPGDVRYDYSLPGNNESNRVRALVVHRGAEKVCLVADITESFGNSRFEISCFTLQGAFIETVPTLAGLPRYGDPIKQQQPFGINLDGEPLRAATAEYDQIIIQGSRYIHDTNGSADARSSWTEAGDFAASVSVSTGELVRWQDFGQQSVSSLEREGFRWFITVEGDRRAYVSPGFLPNSSAMMPGQLNPAVASAVVPEIVQHLHGSTLENYADELNRFATQLYPEVDHPVTTGCVAGTDVGCEARVESSPVTVSCPDGGTLTITPFAVSDIPFGSGRTTGTGEIWDFDVCRQPLEGYRQSVRVHGRFENERSRFTSVQADVDNHARRFTNLRFSDHFSDVSILVDSGELRTSVTGDSRNGQTIAERTGSFTQMYWKSRGSSLGQTLVNGRVGRVIVTPRGNSFYAVRDPASGIMGGEQLGFTFSMPRLELEGLQVSVTEAFSTSFIEVAGGIRFPASTGELSIVSPAGDSLSAVFQNATVPDGLLPANFYGDEVVAYTVSTAGTQFEFTKPSASLYLPWHTP